MIWVDAGAGASGDMLLGALLDLDPAGLPHAQAAVDEVVARLSAEPVTLGAERTRRAGLSATRAVVATPDSDHARTWADLNPAVTGLAHDVFARLAEAEALVHGVPVGDVHFHEVGALDAIADIVAVCALWSRLDPDRTVVSPVCVGSGAVTAAHGSLPVPAPAVAELLRGVPTFAGPVPHEACTPTGAALLRTLADEWGPQPHMAVRAVGVGAGGRDPSQRPNVLRLFTGDGGEHSDDLVQFETTIDDLDPRLYPDVLDALRAAGAVEAWWTPVVMKHGRPAVTLTGLVSPVHLDAVTETLFRHTTTLGARWFPVSRRTLTRDWIAVPLEGGQVRVKRGWQGAELLTVQPEYADVAALARQTGHPVRELMERARGLGRASARTQKSSDATDGGDSDVRTPRT